MKRDWIRLSARIRGARDHSDGGVPPGTSFIMPECCGLARANPSVATPYSVQEMPTWPGSVPRMWTSCSRRILPRELQGGTMFRIRGALLVTGFAAGMATVAGAQWNGGARAFSSGAVLVGAQGFARPPITSAVAGAYLHTPFRAVLLGVQVARDRKSTRLNSSHGYISYAAFCLKKKTRRSPAAIAGLDGGESGRGVGGG